VAEFEARELDLLEDALEGLEDVDDLDALGLAQPLSDRLGEYQDVLALCREAFPTEAPDDHLLDEVIAEAREVSRRPKLRESADAGGAWRRFWERWRGTLVPGVALAGTAAAVLWILEPDRSLDPEADRLAERSDDLEADEREADDSTPDNSKAASKNAALEPAPRPTPERPGVDEGAEAGVDTSEDEPKLQGGGSKAKRSRKSAGKSVAPEPALAPEEPAPEPLSKDDTWQTLEQANAARRAGACGKARKLYDQILAVAEHSLVIAKAKAGIGLCLEQDRRDGEAATWLQQARASSPSVNAWIDDERDRQPLPGEKKAAKKAAPLKSKKSAVDQAL
jgi:hypothetical protein